MKSKLVKWRRMTAVLLSMAMILVNGSQVFAGMEGSSSEPSAGSADSQTESTSEEEPAEETSSEDSSSSEPGNSSSDASSSSSSQEESSSSSSEVEEDPGSSSSSTPEEDSSSAPTEDGETNSTSSDPEPTAPEEEELPPEDSISTGAIAASPRANEYTVIFKDHDGTELDRFVIQEGYGFGTAPELKAESPAGTTFAGWWDPVVKKGYDSSTPITKNVTLQAKYVSSFTVTFYKSDRVTPLKTETVQQNLEDTQTARVPAAEDPGSGAVFYGWSTNKNAEYYDSSRVLPGAASIPVTKTTEYYPLYSHKVTFNANGGILHSSSSYTDTTTRGKSYPDFSYRTPTRVDTFTSQDDKEFVLERKFEFKGWNDAANQPVNTSAPVMADMTFTAQWETLSGTKYTVKLDKDGNRDTKEYFIATNVAEGAVIKSFPTFSQTNLTLKGWYTEPGGQGTKWEDSTTVTGDLTLYPFFDQVECSVNFMANNKQLTSVNAMQGETIANPNIEVPDFEEEIEFEGKGYPVTFRFIGKWAKGADGNGNYWEFEKDTVQENPTKLYAVYSAVPDPEIPQGVYDKIGEECSPENFVSVTFVPNNGANNTVRTLKKGEKVSPLNPPPEKEDYSLAFWTHYTSAKPAESYKKFDFGTAIQQNRTLRAVWRKNAHVYFDTQGGNYIQWKSVPVGETVTKPAEDPKRPGFRFVGWSDFPQENRPSSQFSEFVFSQRIPADSTGNGSDITLYAWYASDTTATFHYNFPDASSEKVAVIEIGEDQQLVLPEYEPESSPAGKVFTGWYTDREGGEKCTAGLTSWPTATNLDVYAHWTDARYLAFDSRGKGTKTIALPPDAVEVTVPDFGVWNNQYIRPNDWFTSSTAMDESTRADFAALLSDGAFTVGTTRTVYAKWTPVSSGSLSVSFDANGGTFVNGNKTVETVSNLAAGIGQIDAASKTINAPISTEQGIRFGGWYFDKECTQSIDTKQYNLVSDLTVYARWVYPVEFYYRGPADTTDQFFGTQYAVKGAKVNSAGRPSIPDRTFQFWTENATGENAVAWDFREHTVTAPVSLFAQCTAVVTYQAGAGASFDQPDLEQSTVWIGGDQTVARPKDPTRDGFRFKGWFLDVNGTKPFTFKGEASPTSVNGNTVLYAVWETVPTHTVTFMKNDGSGASNQVTVNVNEPVSRPEDPDTAGKTFMGWSTNQNAGKGFAAYDFQAKVNSNLTLYAVWAAVVTFDPGENAEFTQPSADARTLWPGGDGIIARPVDPVLDGSDFEGWVTDSGELFRFAGEANPTVVTQNTRLTAKWSGRQFHLIANVEGNGNKGVRILGLDQKTYHVPGERIRLQVEIDPGYRFVSWKSNVDGIIENPTSTDTWLTMPARQTTIVAKAERIKNEKTSDSTPTLEPASRRRSTSDDGSSPAGTFFTAPTPRPAASANPVIDNTGNRGNTVEYSSTQISDLVRANQNNDVAFMYDTYQFIFPRGTMQAQSGIRSYHFGVAIGAEGSATQRIRRLTGRDDDIVVHYEHSGPLPTRTNAQIRLQIGQGLAGESFAYCYYNPQTDTLEKLEEVRADASGWVTVHQNHCSDYVLTRAGTKTLNAVHPATVSGSDVSSTPGIAGRILPAEDNAADPQLPGRIVQTAEVTVAAAEKSALSAGAADGQGNAPEPSRTVDRDTPILAVVILLAGAFLITAGLLKKRLERGNSKK